MGFPALIAMVFGLNMPLSLPMRLPYVPDQSVMKRAALSLAALTAWQALFKKGNLQAGQRILIQGAAGGVGNYAVQLAHLKGAYVIAVASGQHRETLLGLGADEVIDYTTTNFAEVVSDIDCIFDVVGASVIAASFKLLKPEGIYVGIASNAYNLVSKYARAVPEERGLVHS